MNNYKLAAALIGGFALGAGAASVYAQGTTPYYEVAEINVKDHAGYEASGVDKVREAIKAAGGKVIAGGYKKAELIAGNGEPANRFLITMYPSKAASAFHCGGCCCSTHRSAQGPRAQIPARTPMAMLPTS